LHEPITDHVPDCPQAISNVIDRMLAKEPSERYQHASDILNDIANYEALSSRQSSVMSGTFAERPRGLSGHQSQQIAEMNAKRNLLVAVAAAGLSLVAASVVLYLFVFKSDPPKQNDVVIGPNNNRASNNTPSGNGNDQTPEVPKHVKKANEALNTALIQADMLAREGTIKALQEARDLLFNAKAKAPSAEKDVIKKVSDQIEAYDKNIEDIVGSSNQLQTDLDEMKRQVVGEIDKFKYSGAKEVGFAYRDKLEKDPSDAAKNMLKYIKKYLETELPSQSQRHLGKFIAKIENELNIARRELKAANALKLIAPIKEKVEDAETACDDEAYKQRLATLKESVIKLEKQKKNAAQQDDNDVKFTAFRTANRKLDNMLTNVRNHVALGEFKAAEDALSKFETTCPEYKSYKDDKLFAPLVNDVRLRREQSEYELAGIVALSKANRWIPRIAGLLKENSWPAEFADIIGGDNFIIQFKMAKSGDPAWSLEIRDPSDISNIIKKDASEFRTPAMRKALGNAVGLILLNTDIMSEIDKPVSKDGPSALVGLYAWMLELGANGQAYEVISYRYNKVKEGDSDYAVTREYYAYGLLAKAMQLNDSGDKSDAEAILRELDSKFSDTRAAKGRS
ncbi:MAG: hypothetical protein L3J82_04815, partial [Planctomycetes bacterium]|nr:hypothetical protein [Planctomycetota bacterium]